MRFLKVNLWGQEIGRLVWDSATRRSYFAYNAESQDRIPDIAPLIAPAAGRNVHLPIYGDDRHPYQGLPPFIADSLPDSWGNTLFDKWVRENKIPRNKITPLYKLMFIGTRGMGALEYEPCAADLAHTHSVDIKSLYDMSLGILEERKDIILSSNDALTLQALLAVGTSAGGRQMKAIIAIDSETGEIRSGQTDVPDGYDYYILKFGDRSMPMAEIETAYYDMAVAAGIKMEECRLMPADGVNHFLTRRFDRKDGRKIHVQTLAAINPEARSYEDLFATCRSLDISESETEQLFMRLVFNIMANNTDDHNKNFSFLLEQGGKWRIAPAYDITFIFNLNGTGPNIGCRLSVNGKTAEITKADLIDFAKQNGIKNVNAVIDRVAAAISDFDEHARRRGITQPWRGIIRKALNDNLISFGFIEPTSTSASSLSDRFGRNISDITFSVNTKGHYEVAAVINGTRRRRFVRPNMPLYPDLSQLDIYNIPTPDKLRLIETLLPPE